ncbi:MAG: beta-lactamase family protein [Verrucomicrobiae bacterium]|nr:beta-lactamase family protein [Verrucomicrobiae bacterium]
MIGDRISPVEAGLNTSVLNELDAEIAGFIDSGKLPGAIVLIARHGKIGYLNTAGTMGVDRPEKMRSDAVFRIYSMTKPITTAVALMLHEQGAFALDDPVARWLPTLQHMRLLDGSLMEREITVRDLMCHTAGFTNTFASDPLAIQYRREKLGTGDLDRLVDVLGRMPLLHQPGERFQYSIATDVLGKLIEIWAAAPLDRIFRERLFEPLGMVDTGFTIPDRLVESGRFTSNHTLRPDGSLVVTDAAETSRYRQAPERLAGASGLVSTAADYFRFGQLLLDAGLATSGRLLKAESVSLMTSNQLPESAFPVGVMHPLPGLGFGLGMSVRVASHQDTDPGAPVGECGWGGLAGTHFWISPAHGLLVITLRQTLPYGTRFENVLKPVIYRALL